MYTVGDIRNAVDTDFDSDWNEFLYLTEDEGIELPSLGESVKAKEVESGGEKYMWVVFQIGSQYFRMNGSHDSWEGTEWDGTLEEVEPYNKVVVDYRSVKR